MHNPEANPVKLVCCDQPYEIALLLGYKRDCNYCGIDFVAKPNQVRIDCDPFEGMFFDIIWDHPIFSPYLGAGHDKKIYFAVVGPNSPTCALETVILEAIDMACTVGTSGGLEYAYHCKRLMSSDTNLITRVEAAYKRKFASNYELPAPPYSFDKLKKDVQKRISNEIFKELGVSLMVKNVPVITRCIINDPAVVVFWSDGTKTIGKRMGDDEFNPEIGLAMAISRKYYELIGFPNPRSAFKNQLNIAEDRSAKTKEKRECKKKLHDAAKAED